MANVQRWLLFILWGLLSRRFFWLSVKVKCGGLGLVGWDGWSRSFFPLVKILMHILFLIWNSRPANNPPWLPPDTLWVGPTKRHESEAASALTPAQFSANEKRVLAAAYISAGYDPITHISSEHCLDGKKQGSDIPFRVPLQLSKTFMPQCVQGSKPTEDTTFIPIQNKKNSRARAFPSPVRGKFLLFFSDRRPRISIGEFFHPSVCRSVHPLVSWSVRL